MIHLNSKVITQSEPCSGFTNFTTSVSSLLKKSPNHIESLFHLILSSLVHTAHFLCYTHPLFYLYNSKQSELLWGLLKNMRTVWIAPHQVSSKKIRLVVLGSYRSIDEYTVSWLKLSCNLAAPNLAKWDFPDWRISKWVTWKSIFVKFCIKLGKSDWSSWNVQHGLQYWCYEAFGMFQNWWPAQLKRLGSAELVWKNFLKMS